MKHIELLNLICKHRKIIDEGYRKKSLLFVPDELVEIGLFHKIGESFYLNDIYIEFVNTLLNRADLNYIIEDFEKELKRLIELKNQYELKRDITSFNLIKSMILKIYQGMQNRDKNILALIEGLENDRISDIDILINEAKRILVEIEEAIEVSKNIVKVLEELEKFDELKGIVFNVIFDVINLNKNIDSYLKRIRDFINQTEKKRIFNQKLFKLAIMILEENSIVDSLLSSKEFKIKCKIRVVPDSVDRKRVKKYISKVLLDRKSKKEKIQKPIEEIVKLIDINSLIKKLDKGDDIFEKLVIYLKEYPEFISEALRVYVYILNHYDKEVEYTDDFNKYNVRIVRWKKRSLKF